MYLKTQQKALIAGLFLRLDSAITLPKLRRKSRARGNFFSPLNDSVAVDCRTIKVTGF